jgi:hypothetical protein
MSKVFFTGRKGLWLKFYPLHIYPFWNEIDYKNVMITLPFNESSRMIDFLERIPQEEVIRLRTRLHEIRHLYRYDYGDMHSPDAFSHVLLEICRLFGQTEGPDK